MLIEDPQLLWLSQTGLPQMFTIECTDSKIRSLRTFGWYCWHAYTSNPAEIRLEISQDGVDFEQIHEHFEGAKEAGLHFRGFEPPIDLGKYKYLRFRFTKTYGADRVYMNRLYLFQEPIEKVKVHMERIIQGKRSSTSEEEEEEVVVVKTPPPKNITEIRLSDDRWPLSVTSTPDQSHVRSDEIEEEDNNNKNEMSVEKLRAQIQEMETLVSRCVKSASPESKKDHVDEDEDDRENNDDDDDRENTKKISVTIPMTPPRTPALDPETSHKMEMCMSSIDKIERRVKRLSEALGSVTSQVDRLTPERRREKKKQDEEEEETLTPSSVKQQLESMLQNVLTAWASQLLKVQSEAMQRRLDHRLKLERQGMIQELMKAQHEFTEKWSKRQNGKFEALVRDTIVKAAAEKKRKSRRKKKLHSDEAEEDRLERLVARRASELAKVAARSAVPQVGGGYDEEEIRNEIKRIVRPYHPEKWVPAEHHYFKKKKRRNKNSFEERINEKIDEKLARTRKSRSTRRKPFR